MRYFSLTLFYKILSYNKFLIDLNSKSPIKKSHLKGTELLQKIRQLFTLYLYEISSLRCGKNFLRISSYFKVNPSLKTNPQ